MYFEDMFCDSSYAKIKIHFQKLSLYSFLLFLLETSIKRSLSWFPIINMTEGEKIVVSFGISHLKVVGKYTSAFPMDKEII